jgi:MYXO-CTERM domain-containing protein
MEHQSELRGRRRGALSLPAALLGVVVGLSAVMVLDAGRAPRPPADTGDSGAVDSGAVDSGAVDSGVVDSGAADGGATDSGGTDSGGAEADSGGACDSGADACVELAGGADLAGEKGGCHCAAGGGAASLPLALLLGLALPLLRRRR